MTLRSGQRANGQRQTCDVTDNNSTYRRMVVVGDHDPEPTQDVCIVCSPSDSKRRTITAKVDRS
jgi:hypothetical protein